jgi:hypothetical protein
MTDRDAVGIGDRYAQAAAGARRGSEREGAAQVRVQRAEAVSLPRSFGQAEQRAQREHQVR